MTNVREILEKIKPCSDEEAEKCEWMICVPASTPSRFNDDLYGHCVECGVKVRYRWHAPRKPKRICLDCMVKRLDNGAH